MSTGQVSMAHTLTDRLLRYVSVSKALQGCVCLRKKKKKRKRSEMKRSVLWIIDSKCNFLNRKTEQKKVMKKLFSNEMKWKEGPDMLKTKEHRQFRWSRCMRTGKKQSACRRTWRCLWTRKANKCCRYPGVAPACTWLSLLWRIEREDLGVLLRHEQESIGAVVTLVAETPLHVQWDVSSWSEQSTWTAFSGWLQLCNPAVLEVDFQLSSFSTKIVQTTNWFCCEEAVVWQDSCRYFAPLLSKFQSFSIHLVTKPPCLSKEVPKHVQDDRTYW